MGDSTTEIIAQRALIRSVAGDKVTLALDALNDAKKTFTAAPA
jgi:hypothetical protein